MMRKITVRGVDADLYDVIRMKAVREHKKVGDIVNELFYTVLQSEAID